MSEIEYDGIAYKTPSECVLEGFYRALKPVMPNLSPKKDLKIDIRTLSPSEFSGLVSHVDSEKIQSGGQITTVQIDGSNIAQMNILHKIMQKSGYHVTHGKNDITCFCAPEDLAIFVTKFSFASEVKKSFPSERLNI